MAAVAERVDTPVSELRTAVFTVPTDAHESDGTLEWDETTLVLVEVEAGGQTGIGGTHAAAAAAKVVGDLIPHVAVRTTSVGLPGVPPGLQPRACAALRRRVRGVGGDVVRGAGQLERRRRSAPPA